MYIGSNVALIRYFWCLPERNTWTHIVLPALGVVALGYPLYIVVQPGQAHPYNLVALVVGLWIALGAVLLVYFRARSPEKVAALGSFIAEEEGR